MLTRLWNESHCERSSRFLFLLPQDDDVPNTGSRALEKPSPHSTPWAALKAAGAGWEAGAFSWHRSSSDVASAGRLCSTPLPSWGNSKGSSFAAPLPRFILSCLDFEQTIGYCSLARAWLETAADLGEGKVNFKSPSCTCVGTCSCVRTDAASFVHVSYSYGSGLWSKINNKKWVGH